MAAGGEEVLVQADPLELEHVGPDRGQRALQRGDRRGEAVGTAGTFRGAGLGRGQRAALELAVGAQRQRREPHEVRGHHVVGQAGRQRGRGRGGVEALARHVGHQAAVAGAELARHHHGFAHARQAGDGRLDLAGLDAQAAQLELLVDAAEVFERAVGQVARQVAAAVHALARRGREGIGHEALGAQRGAVQVAAREPDAGDVEFARHAGRGRLAGLVEHVETGVGDRLADGDHGGDRGGDRVRGRAGLGRRPAPGRHVDRGLGRAIEVVQGHSRQRLREARHQRGGQRLAAAHHLAQRRQRAGRPRLQEGVEHRGHEVQCVEIRSLAISACR